MKSGDQQHIESNRATFLRACGSAPERSVRVQIVFGRSDYTRYRLVDRVDQGKGITRPSLGTYDGLATRTPGLTLFLPLADCMGAIIFDPRTRMLMISHLGRHSTEQDGGIRSVEYLRHIGCRAADLRVWLGPAPSKARYPLWRKGGRGFTEEVPAQFRAAGVLSENIVCADIATDRDPDFFSHSEYLAGRQTTDGRYAICARMR